jgi:regulator of protease activity HflC (stomatin/prohibitin superfamily)
MKKQFTIIALLMVAGLSFTSCRGYEREQGELDATSKGKQQLYEAQYGKQASIETAKANKASAKLNAETQVIKAKADAEARIINAQAEATTRIMGAEAKAKANIMLNQSLTPALIDYLEVDRWNGVLPTTVAGSGANTIVGLK